MSQLDLLRYVIRGEIHEASKRKSDKDKKLPPLETSPVLDQWVGMLKALHGRQDPDTGETIDIEQWLGADLFGSRMYPGGFQRRQRWDDQEDPYPKGAASLIVRALATDPDEELRSVARRLLAVWHEMHAGGWDSEEMKLKGSL
jgi:hypothetical protein